MLRCLFNHDFKRIGPVMPMRDEGEFAVLSYKGHYALGKCTQCGMTSLRKCHGTFKFAEHEMLTEAEYREKYSKEETVDKV